MCSYPVPVQGVFLAFAALGVMSLMTTVWFAILASRSRIDRPLRVVRYADPQPETRTAPGPETLSMLPPVLDIPRPAEDTLVIGRDPFRPDR